MGVKWHRQPCGDLALPTLGADVANAAFGEAKVGGWVHVGRQEGGGGGGGSERTKHMYLTFGFVVWRAFLLSLDDIVGMVAALSLECGCWTWTTTGVGMRYGEVWIQ